MNQQQAIAIAVCERKKPYPSLIAAQNALVACQANQDYDGGKLQYYRCGRCKQWHIGHVRGSKARVAMQRLIQAVNGQ